MNHLKFRQAFFACRQIIPFVVFLSLLLSFKQSSAQGNLLITPRRVVFEGSKKTQELNLANIGHDTATYYISLIEIAMKEDGSFERITEPVADQKFASKFIRIFPRKVVLAPNETQVIKLQLTKTDQLQEGEYRSHLYFRADANNEMVAGNEVQKDTAGISVHLTPVFGITIPAIVRVGQPMAKVSLTNPSIEMIDNRPRLNIIFNRSGNASAYGDLSVDFVSLQNKVIRVAEARGVAIYTPNQKRHFHIDLNMAPGVNYNAGKLLVTYKTQKDAKSEILAETELLLDDNVLVGLK